MTDRIDKREAIATALQQLEATPLPEGARQLFACLGYESKRVLPIATVSEFCAYLDAGKRLTDRERSQLDRLTSLHLLFQLTDSELTTQADLFDDSRQTDGTRILSYLFFAAELPPATYTRTELAGIARAINKPLAMPALVLFRHGESITLAIIHRRLNKRQEERDVLEKATLIKDIRLADPIRAHLEILNDFALENLSAETPLDREQPFVSLHQAWQKKLASYALSNAFYREIADWYFWALHKVDDGTIRLPQHCDTEQEKSLFLIRLLTRVIFCWFLVEKRLIPPELFRGHSLKKLLKDLAPHASTYYHAILQNLFFGTLNMPPDQRAFRKKADKPGDYDKNYGITNLWRYENDFRDRALWESLAARIPFLNGGLFDCLDDKSGKKKDNFILDGFSDNPKLACHLPNDLFFGPERTVDLSKDYGEEDKRTARSKRAKVRGLIEILSRYKFTIEENTPLEEEIALDPELLGKVFENLLASYNEDTRTTARKALGAFYTPREIVSYMVDEALKSYLAGQVPRCKGLLDLLFSNKPEGLLKKLEDTAPGTKDALIAAIGRVKILDPACGSGAFPMGALHRLVDLLQKLDPNNESWKRDRLAEARRYRELLRESGAGKDELAACDARIADIEKSFDTRYHALDFARKLYLIENAIYGVDIQPIATQIAKLRFFIALVVDQKVEPKAPNLGVRPLPNLETRLVAADTLIPIEKAESDLFSGEIDRLRAELAAIRHEHFNARSPAAKRKWREADAAKRAELAAELEKSHALSKEAARQLAAWDPYDQNTSAPFFDPEWMFGLPVGKVRLQGKAPATLLGNLALINEVVGQTELTPVAQQEVDSGFDIVIGNPPYVRQEQLKHLKDRFKQHYACFTGTADLYVYFYEAGIKLLRNGGTFSFITSNKWFRAGYGEKLRAWLAQNTRVLQLIDFGDAPVFTAIAYPCIVIVQRTEQPVPADATVRALTWEPDPPIETFADVFARKSFTLPQRELKPDGWRLESSATLRLLERLRAAGKPLGEYVNGRFYRGVLTGLNEAFVVDRATRDRLIAEHPSSAEVLKPFLRGRDVKRWRVDSQDLWLIFTRRGIDIKKYPAILSHLKPFKSRLMPGAPGGRKPGSYQWYEIQDNIAYWQEFEQPKIIIPAIQNEVHYATDGGIFYSNDKTSIIVPERVNFVLAVLNSCVSWWITQQSFASKQGGYFEFKPMYVSQIPIPPATDAQQATIERLVDYLLWLHRHLAEHPGVAGTRDALMVAYWERVLNGLVYELYFPDELHAAGLRLFDLAAAAEFPDVTQLPEPARLKTLRAKFEELADAAHPLHRALDKLATLDTICIIEGKA